MLKKIKIDNNLNPCRSAWNVPIFDNAKYVETLQHVSSQIFISIAIEEGKHGFRIRDATIRNIKVLPIIFVAASLSYGWREASAMAQWMSQSTHTLLSWLRCCSDDSQARKAENE